MNSNDFITKPQDKIEYPITKAIDLIKEIENEPEAKILWNGIIEGSKGLIVGIAKTGKTTFAENLAISLATGRKEFYGHQILCGPKRVLFINLEEKFVRMARRNKKQIISLSENELKMFSDNYYTNPKKFIEYLNNENDWMTLRNYIIQINPDIVFIDSISHMCIGEIEKSSVAQNFTQNLNKYLYSLEKTFIMIHHNVKGNDKPIDQGNIAGSRFISQEFDFAYGFSNIPTKEGGNYSCMLYNKDIQNDDNQATIYKINNYGWFENLSVENKYVLYEERKMDFRINSKNKDELLDFFKSSDSSDSSAISTSELTKYFVDKNIMSKTTLFECLKKLVKEGAILREENGLYRIKTS